MFSTVPQNNGEISKTLYLPVRIEQARFYARPGVQVWSHALLKNISTSALEGDVRVYDDDGSVLMDIRGFKCAAVGGVRGDDSDHIEKWFYDLKWHSKPRPEKWRFRDIDYIPGSREIAERVENEMYQLINDLGWSEKFYSKLRASLDRIAVVYILGALRDLGLELKLEDRISVGSLMEELKLLPKYQPLMGRFMGFLENAGYLNGAGEDAWVVSQLPVEQDPQEIWQRAWWQYPAYFAELSLIGRCGSKLADVLQGKIDPLQVLFSEGSITTAEHLYQDSPSFRPYNLLVQKAVTRALAHLPEGRIVRILEIGAGTGGMTAYLLPSLPADRTEYVFSDVSKLFLHKAEQKFRRYPFVRYPLLDIESDPLEQGYDPHSFDVILASDVLHGTKHLSRSLEHILKLLSSRGLLVILEAERASTAERAFSWIDLVFGLTPGWWNFRDFDLRPDYPLITRAKWKAILEKVGLDDIEAVSLSRDCEEPGQVVLLARGPSIAESSEDLRRDKILQDTDSEKGTWLILADRGGVAQQVVELLKLRGEACISVSPGEGFQRIDENHFQISPDRPEHIESLLEGASALHQARWRGVIHFWSLDAPRSEDACIHSLQLSETLGCHSVLRFIQALEKPDKRHIAPRVVLVTRGAQPISDRVKSVSIGQAPLIGLGRVIFNEFPNLRCKMVDLGPEHSPSEIQSLFAELWIEDAEEEIALRHHERFVPRVERATREAVPAHRADGQNIAFRVDVSKSGVIDDLTPHETKRRKPAPGEVEIEVCAAALNFRDVMKALGLLPREGDYLTMLGDECAGRIVAIGEGVDDLRVGDEVIAIASGSFGSYATTSAGLVVRKSAHLTFEEAVTLPSVFLTAYYALHLLARIRSGERILIHSATGGVGLAALQIARDVGAEVFATAGSPEKRELLQFLGVEHVMDSRSLSFADEIMEITGGKGVDIVLNSLAGKAISKGLWCLAPYGRFLELGKRDIYQNSKLGLWAFRKNLSFFAVDLGSTAIEKPMSLRPLLSAIAQCIDEKRYGPLPHRVFPVSRIADAFSHMAQARHIGKIVISMRDEGVLVEPSEQEAVAFRPDATYLITGGLGGFGLTIAKWIVESGGRNLVLMGRSGAEADDAKKGLEDLQKTGAQVVVAKADVSSDRQLGEVLAEMDRTMPPLRGIFHAAMVLDDGILLQLDAERFRNVMVPKVDGTWNLHAQTLNRSLDFFVLFSSASSLIGRQGQGNYAAANSFLDAFAYYRRSLGLPAIAVNWGHLAEVGYVSRHSQISELLTRIGIEGISTKQAVKALGLLLRRKPIQRSVMRIDWEKLLNAMPKEGLAQRFSSLIGESKLEQKGSGETRRMREVMLEAKQESRQEIIETYIQEQVARVLGTAGSKIDADRSLNELGLDSLMAVELKNRIESDLDLSLPMGQLMQSPTIRRFSSVVLNQLIVPASTPSAPPLVRQETPEQLLAQVDRLSDEEVDSLLRKMMSEETRNREEEMRG